MIKNITDILLSKKTVYLCLFSMLFYYIFMYNAFDNWGNKYRDFGVNSMTFPGGDSRNIQKAALCYSKGFSYYSDNDCFNNSKIITDLYPESQTTPAYNYPPIVADVYGFFNDFSESFFQKFWFFNMLLLFVTILVYSFKYNYLLFPVILFSPVTLLAIERANIDGTAFAILFLPLILSTSIFIHLTFIGLASSIKLFPIVSYLILFRDKTDNFIKKLSALIIVLPLLLYSLFYFKEYTKATLYGFQSSFGLFSLKNSPYLINYSQISTSLIIVYLILIITLVFFMLRAKRFMNSLLLNIKKLNKTKIHILLISLIVYISVFVVFTNWGYRFIFLIPAFLILSKLNDFISRISFSLIFITLWIPLIPHGWSFFNLFNYALFPWISIIFIISYKVHFLTKIK